MTRHPGIVFRALTWNLFHGRDFPPDRSLLTWRSRLLRTIEQNETHAQVNRPLFDEFADVLAREPWEFALLQEAPPRWFPRLCERLEARGAIALTSRNLGGRVRARLAEWNPDLIASNEGGSNQILVRAPWRIAATERLTLARRPERRRALWIRVEREDTAPLAIVNLHASTERARTAASEILLAASGFADERLIFGGDLNLRPAAEPEIFAELRERFGLSAPTEPAAIDHLLVRGLEVLEPPAPLSPEAREVADAHGLRIRLSDHAPVAARFAMR